MVFPTVARDLQSLLWIVRVLNTRQLYSPNQPSIRDQPRPSELLQVYWSLFGFGNLPSSIPRCIFCSELLQNDAAQAYGTS